MSRTRKLLLVILAMSVVYLASGVILTATAASPYMNVKFLRVLVNAIVDGDLTVSDDMTIADDLVVSGDAVVAGDLDVTTDFDVDGDTTLDVVEIAETLDVDGATVINNTVYVTGTLGVADVISTAAGVDIQTGNLVLPNDEYFSNDTDGVIEFGITGGVEYSMTATALHLRGNELFFDADSNTSIHGDTDNQLDFTIDGAVDAVFAANLFQLSGGTVLEVDTINEETADAGVATEGVTHIDGGITVTANILLTGDFELDGVIRDTSGAVTIEKAAFIDGTADDVQLRVQASGVGQASNIIVIEDEDGNDGFRVDRIGDTWISGTVTIVNGDLDVDAGDAQFDGAVTVTFGSILYVSDIVEASGDEGVNIESISVVDGALTVDDITISSFINYVPQTPIVIADGGWLTPTGTFQGIAAAGSIGFSRIYTTGFTDGDILILYNTIAQTIVITDENDTNLNTDRTLGIGDILSLIYTNTAWFETGYTDN